MFAGRCECEVKMAESDTLMRCLWNGRRVSVMPEGDLIAWWLSVVALRKSGLIALVFSWSRLLAESRN